MKKLIDTSEGYFKEYFRDCNIVMSAPNVFFYSGEHAVIRGIPAIVQAMPTRVYVGIKKREINDCPIEIKGYIDNAFYDSPHLMDSNLLIGQNYLTAYVKCRFQKSSVLENIKESIGDISIKVLTDILPGSGANWSGAYSSALAGCIYFNIIKRYSLDEITNILNRFELKWSKIKNYEEFKEINLFSFFLEMAFHGGSASGYGNYMSLLGPSTPYIYKCVKRYSKSEPYVNVYSGLRNRNSIDNENDTKVVINRLQEITQETKIIELNKANFNTLYVAVVDTGTRKTPNISTSMTLKSVYDNLMNDTEKCFQDGEIKEILGNDIRYNPSFIYSWLDYACIAFCKHFKNVLSTPTVQPDECEILFKYMNAIGQILLSYGLGWKEFENIRSKIFIKIDGLKKSNTAVKLSGAGNAGICVVMSAVTQLLNENTLSSIVGAENILYSSDKGNKITGLKLHEV